MTSTSVHDSAGAEAAAPRRDLSRRWSARRWCALGFVGVLVSFGCAAGAYSAQSRAFATGDEVAHADYAVRVYHGELPVFEDGQRFTPPVHVPSMQTSAQHPPLYYLLAAPLVGPFADRGEWREADAAGRALSVVLGAGCLLAMAWAAAVLVTRRRALWALATPALVAPFLPFIAVSASIYNDTLAILAGAIAVGVAIRVLQRGLSSRLLVAAMAIGSAGMLARASFFLTLAALVGAVGLAPLLHGPGSWRRRLLRGVGAGAAVLAAVAVTSGWFYLRNVRLTGNLLGGHADYAVRVLNRSTSTISQVLTSEPFWTVHLDLLPFRTGQLSEVVVRIVFGGLVALALVAGAVALVRRRPRIHLPSVAIAVVLVSQVLGTIAFRANHVAAGGGNHFRYLLTMLLPVALLLAAGALAWRYWGGVVAGAVVLVEWWLFFGAFDLTPVVAGEATVNGVPAIVVLALYGGVVVGAVVQAVSFVLAGVAYRRSSR